MRGFDTNLLVRYLVRDDPEQAAVVEHLIAETIERDGRIFLNHIVLCETAWVLEAGYGHERDVIADAIEKLLQTKQFEFEERDLVWRGLRRFQYGKADFADYLIGEKNVSSGCDRTSTFDLGLEGEEGFDLLSARSAP